MMFKKVGYILVAVFVLVICCAFLPKEAAAQEDPPIASVSISMGEIAGCSERDAQIVREMAARAPSSTIQPREVWSAIDEAKRGGGWQAYSDGGGRGTCWWAEIVARAVNQSPLLTPIEWWPHNFPCPGLSTVIEEKPNGDRYDYEFRNDSGRPVAVELSIANGLATATVRYASGQSQQEFEQQSIQGQTVQDSQNQGTAEQFVSCEGADLGPHSSGCWCSSQCASADGPSRVLVVKGNCTPCGTAQQDSQQGQATQPAQMSSQMQARTSNQQNQSEQQPSQSNQQQVAQQSNPASNQVQGRVETVKYSWYWPPKLGTNCALPINGQCRSTVSGCQSDWEQWPGKQEICQHTYRSGTNHNGDPLWTSDWNAMAQRQVLACPKAWPFGTRVYKDGQLFGICADRGGAIEYDWRGNTFIDDMSPSPVVPFKSYLNIRVVLPSGQELQTPRAAVLAARQQQDTTGRGCPSNWATTGVWPEGTLHSQYALVCCGGEWISGSTCP